MSGGAGYVLSREALRRFKEEGLDKGICRKDDDGVEDGEAGICLEKVGVKAMDGRDELGEGRFFPFEPSSHIKPGHMNGVRTSSTRQSINQSIDRINLLTNSSNSINQSIKGINQLMRLL
jgi:hypothetical protein